MAAWKTPVALLAIAVSACAPARIETSPAPASILLAVVTWNMNAGRGDLPRLVSDVEAGRLTSGVPGDFVLLLQEAVDAGGSGPVRVAVRSSLAAVFFPVRDDGRRSFRDSVSEGRRWRRPLT